MPKPRSRPLVVFNAAGQPTIVRSTATPSAAGTLTPAAAAAAAAAASGNGDVDDAAAGATVPLAQYTIPAPRKKSRLGDIDLSKATILTAQQHAAEQPKHPQKRAKVKLTLPPKAASSTSGTSSSSSGGAEESATLVDSHHLSTPPALIPSSTASSTHALDFLASVAMESNDAPVRDIHSNNDDLLGYKRSFGSMSSPPAPINVSSPKATESTGVLSPEAMTY